MVQSVLQQKALLPGDVVPKYRTIYVPFNSVNGWAAALVGSGAGAPIIGELTTSSLAGVRIQADADSFAFLYGFQDDVNVNAPIDVRIVWSSDQTTIADTYTWNVNYSNLSEGVSANTAAATAIGTAIATAVNNVLANGLQFTEWGTFAAGSFTGTISDGYIALIELIATTNGGTVSTDLVIWFGIEFRYMPKRV